MLLGHLEVNNYSKMVTNMNYDIKELMLYILKNLKTKKSKFIRKNNFLFLSIVLIDLIIKYDRRYNNNDINNMRYVYFNNLK